MRSTPALLRACAGWQTCFFRNFFRQRFGLYVFNFEDGKVKTVSVFSPSGMDLQVRSFDFLKNIVLF
jgi:hypothetical protein